MPRRPSRLAAATLAATLLPGSIAAPLAQPWGGGGYGYVPPQAPPYGYAQQPPGYGGSPKFAPGGAPPPPRAAAPVAAPRPAAGPPPVEAGVRPEELRLQEGDPPAVVGRIARTTGNATLRLPGDEDWQPAALNTPVAAGTALWTEPGSRAALEVAQNRMFLEGGTALQLDELDEDGLRATLAQGSAFLRLRGLEEFGGIFEVATPEATLATALDGRYAIEAAAPDGSRPGRFTVYEGAAEITPAGGGEAIRLGPGDALVFPPGGAAPERVPAGAATPLMAWALAAEPRAPVPLAARGMTGIDELTVAGRWDRSADYGDVWYPPVGQDWSPYNDGSWQWRDGWGWTWVDAAPWGFATSHYGRWVQVGPRWGWAPAPVPLVGLPRLRPVWAPALVAFFGGVAVGALARPYARPVGWVPLGPREPWYPWYRASPGYVQRVNLRQVTNVVNVRNVWVERGGRDLRWDGPRRDGGAGLNFYDAPRGLEGFRNRRAAVQVPEQTMLGSLPVRREAQRLPPDALRQVSMTGGLPLRPGGETRGVTERSAERFGLRPDELRPGPDRPRGPAPPPDVRAALGDPGRRADGLRREGGDLRRGPDGRPDADLRRGPDGRPDGDLRRGPDGRPDADLRRGPDGRPDGDLRRGPDGRPDADLRRGEDGLRGPQAGVPPVLRAPGGPAADADAGQRRQELRQRLIEEQGRGQQARPDRPPRLDDTPGRDAPPRDTARAVDGPTRQQELRQRLLEDQGRRQPPPGGDQANRPGLAPDQGRRQEDPFRRQQEDQFRRQQEDQTRRQQVDQLRRQQEDQLRRQQDDQMRRQQADQIQRQQQDQVRRQQEQMQRQQQDQVRRQQEDQIRRQQADQIQRQQQDQVRRQQEDQIRRQQADQIQRQQQDQMRRQQEQSMRQQEQARQQQDQMRRQQEQAMRQQEQARQQQDQMRRQQEQAMRQQEQARRQQEQGQRQQQQEQQRRQQQQQQR